MLTSLAASETAGIPSCHTQLLVYRQEWDELQHDVLEKVGFQISSLTMSAPLPYLHPRSGTLPGLEQVISSFTVAWLQVMQCIQKRHAQPSRQMLKLVQQQHNQNLAALGSLDSAKSAAHAELIADWPTALDSSDIEHQLPKLHGRQHSMQHKMQPCISNVGSVAQLKLLLVCR